MSDQLIIEGKKYISSRRAAQACGYTQDYIGQLIREKKIEATKVGRLWFVSEVSILEYDSVNNQNSQATSKKETQTEVSIPSKNSVEHSVSDKRDVNQIKTISHSPLKYESDERSLLPELKKSPVKPQITSLKKEEPVIVHLPEVASEAASHFRLLSPRKTVALLVAGMLAIFGAYHFSNPTNALSAYQVASEALQKTSDFISQTFFAPKIASENKTDVASKNILMAAVSGAGESASNVLESSAVEVYEFFNPFLKRTWTLVFGIRKDNGTLATVPAVEKTETKIAVVETQKEPVVATSTQSTSTSPIKVVTTSTTTSPKLTTPVTPSQPVVPKQATTTSSALTYSFNSREIANLVSLEFNQRIDLLQSSFFSELTSVNARIDNVLQNIRSSNDRLSQRSGGGGGTTIINNITQDTTNLTLSDTTLTGTTLITGGADITGLLDTDYLTFINATGTSATTTNLYIGGTIRGAGLASCSGSSDKLIWDSTTGQFSCGTDAGAGGGITSLRGQYSSNQSGAGQVFATSSDANIVLTITSASDIHTFAPSWTGQLSVARGGTGLSSVTNNQLLIGGAGNTVTQIATSSLGLLTTHVSEGSNLYFTNARVLTYLDTLDKGYFFSSTSASYFASQGLAFSTTSSNYWLTQQTLTGFSTTSADNYANLFNAFSVQGNGYLAPTTTRGLIVNASSTIGNGNQNGGLTIYGGATTTGNAYFAGNVGIGTNSASSALHIVSNTSPQFRLGYDASNYLMTGITSTGATALSLNGTIGGLYITNPQPASVSSGNGTAATTSLLVLGATGGDTSDPGVAVFAGTAGGISLIGGTGGLPTSSGTTFAFGGIGGPITLTAGKGGSPTVGGSAQLLGGAGGSLNLSAGAGGDVTSGAGTLIAGAGGTVTVSGGAGGVGSGSAGNGGLVRMVGGNGFFGGNVFIAGGSSYTAASLDGALYLGATTTSTSSGMIYFGNDQGVFNTSTKRLGIGTTSPYAKLSVVGETVSAYFTATTSTASTFPYASTTAITATTASTTNLIISGIGGSTQCLQVNSSGVVSGSGSSCGTGSGSWATTSQDYYASQFNAFSVQGNGYLAPTTTRGLIVNASTTIGNGNQNGGLTIYGGATTTGNMNVLGDIFVGVNKDGHLTEGSFRFGATAGIDLDGGTLDRDSTGDILDWSDDSQLLIGGTTRNIGISTSSPFTRLSVGGSAYIGGNLTATGTASTTNLVITSITGSTQCLQVNTLGQVSGTGSACGSGSGSWATTSQDYYASQFNAFTVQGNGYLAPTTTRGLIVSASSTINANLTISGNSTTTNATTTNLFSSTASSTNLFSTNATLGTTNISGLTVSGNTSLQSVTSGTINGQTISSAANFTGTLTATGGLSTFSNILATGSSTLQNFTALNATTTQATTTNLAISSITSGSILKTTTGGAVIAAVAGTDYLTSAQQWATTSENYYVSLFRDFSVNSFGALAPTTTRGIFVSASSTIGDGTQTGGLTIYGGATTTGTSTLAKLSAGGTTLAPGLQVYANGNIDVGSNGSSKTFSVYYGNGTLFTAVGSTAVVGVGTTTPYAKFAVEGDSVVGGPVFVVDGKTAPFSTPGGVISLTAANAGSLGGAGGSVLINPGAGSSGSDGNVRLADVRGFVGIGTTSPLFKLSVQGNTFIQGTATTTNLVIAGITGSTQCLQVNTLGQVSGSGSACGSGSGSWATTSQDYYASQFNAFSVQGNGYLAPTTTRGIIITASSTIGNGSNGGGLTINGTATTTGTTTLATLGGNVGIGTIAPNYSLHTHKSGSNDNWIQVTSASTGSGVNDGLFFGVTGASPEAQIWSDVNIGIFPSSARAVTFSGSGAGAVSNLNITNTSSGANTNDGLQLSLDGSNIGYLWNYENAATSFGTNNLERMRIASDGNVGIGTSTPNWSLQVASTTPYFALTDTGAISGSKHWLISNNDGLFRIGTSSDGLNSTSTYLTINQAGNVGIGTTSPYAQLSIKGRTTGGDLLVVNDNSNNPLFRIRDDDMVTFSSDTVSINLGVISINSGLGYQSAMNSQAINFTHGSEGFTFTVGINDSNGLIIGTESDKSVMFSTQDTERARISGEGNLGIGTTSPYAKLSIHAGATDTYNKTLFSIASSTATYATTTLFSVGANGTASTTNLAITSITGSTQCLQVNTLGQVSGTGSSCGVAAGSWATTSQDYYASQFNAFTVQGNGYLAPTTTRGLIITASSTIGNGNQNGGLTIYGGATTTGNAYVAGNVGIGTTNPGAKLHIEGNNYPQMRIGESATVYGQVEWDHVLDVLKFQTFSHSYPIQFGNEQLYLKTDGNVGIGTTSPYAKLSVAGETVARNFTATSTTATSTFAGGLVAGNGALSYDLSTGITSIDSLNIGALSFDTDAGIVTWTDMPVTSSAANNTVESYQASIDGTPILTVYAESNGSGGIKNTRVGIGTTTPYAMLSVAGNVVGQYFTATSSTASTFPYASTTAITATTASTTNLIISGIGGSTQCLQVNSSGVVSGSGSACGSGSGGGNSKWATSSLDLLAIYNVGAGNVGLGTSTPYWSLQIASTTPYLALTDTGAISGSKHWLISNNDGLFRIGTSSDGLNSTSTYLTINQAGNVGIGTTSPYAKLSVVGETVARNFTATSTTATSTFAGGLTVGNGALNYDFSSGITSIDSLNIGALSFDTDAGTVSWADMPVTSSAANNTVQSYSAQIDGNPILTVYAESDGSGGIKNTRVGIGTSTPYAMLSVAGKAVVEQFHATSTTATSTISGFLDVLGTGSNATSTYSSNLWVKGNLRATNSYVGDLFFSNDFRVFEDATSSPVQRLFFADQNKNTRLTIEDTGNIGIGTTSPTYKLHVMGDVAAESFVNISTRDSKKDIVYLDDEDKTSVLESIRNIGVATYHYKDEEGSAPLRLGLIAEEAPVEVLAAGGKGVDIYKFSTYILAGVQELDKKFEAVEDRVANLETRLDSTVSLLASIMGSTTLSTTSIVYAEATTTASTTVSIISGWIESLGAKFENAIATFVDVIAKSITAEFAYVKTVEADSVVTKSLKVGDIANLAGAGVTILDRLTGEPVCMYISNGVVQSSPGECGVVNNNEGPVDNGDEGGNGGGGQGTTTPPTEGDGGDTGNDGSGGGDAGTTTPPIDNGGGTGDGAGDEGSGSEESGGGETDENSDEGADSGDNESSGGDSGSDSGGTESSSGDDSGSSGGESGGSSDSGSGEGV